MGAANAYLLWDEYGCNFLGTNVGVADNSLGALDGDSAPLDTLYSYLCDTKGITTNSAIFIGAAGSEYYSYMNALNPMPCMEVVYASTYSFISSQLVSGLASPWTPYETFWECTESYGASMQAYMDVYLSSLLIESMEVFDGDTWAALSDDQLLDGLMKIAGFYGAWGLAWVHSTYPNYKLGSTYGTPLTGAPDSDLTWADVNAALPTWMQGTSLDDVTSNLYSNFDSEYGDVATSFYSDDMLTGDEEGGDEEGGDEEDPCKELYSTIDSALRPPGDCNTAKATYFEAVGKECKFDSPDVMMLPIKVQQMRK